VGGVNEAEDFRWKRTGAVAGQTKKEGTSLKKKIQL